MITRAIIRIRKRISNPLFFLLLIAGFCTQAQDQAFDQAYDKIWKEAAHADLNAAIVAADSLYKASSEDVHRMRSMMLIARLYQQKEELGKSVEYAEKLERLAVESDNYTWQARANAYLAGLYRMMELCGKSRSYSRKALGIVPKIEDAEQANSTRGLLLQELGFASMDEEDHEQAIRHFKEAGKSFDKIQKNKDFNIMNNERLIGDNYRLLTRYDTALVHYRKALKLSETQSPHYVIGLIYKGMAEALMEAGRLPEAKVYLDKAEHIAEESQYLQLKDATYDLAKRYYALVKDQKKLAAAKEKSSSVTDTLLDKRAQLLNRMYTRLDRDGAKAEAISSGKDVVILSGLLLIALVGILFTAYRKKQKRQLAQVRSVLAQFHNKETKTHNGHTTIAPAAGEGLPDTLPVGDIGKDEPEIGAGNPEKRIMPIETEQHLLEKLTEFEKSDAFLERAFSLPALAAQLNTNTKYLSHLINKDKKTDFNGYINKLRIDFVVGMLRKDPTWRQHKISTMAAASGFSSHSQFAAVFKDCTGVSPSIFIKHLTSEIR